MFVAADFSESARSLCDVLKILALEGGESGESLGRVGAECQEYLQTNI